MQLGGIKATRASASPQNNITYSFGGPDNTMDVGRPPQKKRALMDSLKMAATYSPTMRSTIGVAELVVARSALPSAAPSRCAPLPCLPP